MHRTFRSPRLIGWASLLALLTLTFAVRTAAAQGVQPAAFAQTDIQQTSPTITIAIGSSRIYTGKNKLARVENPNSKVINVREVKDDPNSVFLDAVGPGRTTITVLDAKGNRDVFDVIVISDRVKELRETLARAVPTGAINVSSTDSGATIVLTGFVLTSDDARIVQQLAGVGPGIINNVKIGGVQQVQLEVVVAVVDRSKARNMEFSWMVNGPNWFGASILNGFPPYTITSILTTTGAAAGNGFNSSIVPLPGANGAFSVLSPGGSSSFMGFLSALRTEGLTKILAEPRVTTMSGQWGYIVSGGEVPLILPTGVGAPPSITYKQFGTIVQFRPVVKGNGKIYLQVRSELSQLDTTLSANIAGASAPGFDVRSAQVEVEIDEGQTLAIGGLIQNSTTASISRVPVLGDIPGLSMFFTSKTYTEKEEELVILVTPKQVDPFDCTKFPKYLPGLETRSPDDFELFMEGILEAPRGPRNVDFHPHYYKPAYQNAPNVGQFPCAPGTGNNGAGCANGNCGAGNPPMARPAGYATPAPMPSFPDVSALPASTSKTIMAPDNSMPPMRSPAPGLGPVTPTMPTLPPPAREFENRPTPPPMSPGLLGPN